MLLGETGAHSTGQAPVSIFSGGMMSRGDVEAFNRLVEDECLEVERYKSKAQFPGHSRVYQCYFNSYRRLARKGGKRPGEIFAEAKSEDCHAAARPVAFTLPRIVLDHLARFLPPARCRVPVMVRALLSDV